MGRACATLKNVPPAPSTRIASGWPKKAAEAALRRAPLGGVAPLPRVTQQRTVISCPRLRRRGQHTTSAFRSRLAHGAGWDRMPVRYSRISKSNGHSEREQYDRKSLQHSVFLPRYPLTAALVRLTHQRHRISSRHFTGPASPGPQIAQPKNMCMNPW